MPRPGKRKRTSEVVINFDKDSRADYLTGFHQRKVQRTKRAQEEAAKRAREERVRDRKVLRDSRKEELKKHVEAVKAALKPGSESEESNTNSDASEEYENVSTLEQNDIHREDEYIDEDKFTTVTVEPIDFTESSEGKGEESADVKQKEADEADENKPKKTYPKKEKEKEKKKKFTYLTKAERRETTRKIKATKIRRAMEGQGIRKAKAGAMKGKGKSKRK